MARSAGCACRPPHAPGREPSSVSMKSTGGRPQTSSILKMAAPLVLSFQMRSLFTFVDLAFAATLGDAAIAAVGGLSFPYEILMAACWVGVSTGVTSNLSQAMGKRQGQRIDQVLSVSRLVVWSLVPLFTAIALYIYFGADHMGLDPGLARKFSVYGAVLIGGAGVTPFSSIIPQLLAQAHHDPNSTMWGGLRSTPNKRRLNPILLFPVSLGVFGIR